MMGVLRKLATLVFVLALPVVLVTTTIRVVFNEPRIYRYAVDEYDAVLTTGIARSELLRAGDELRKFLNSSDEDAELRIQVAQENVAVPLFNPREVSHLEDVRDRVIWLNRVQLIATLYVLSYMAAVVLWAREVSVRGLAWAVLAASTLTLACAGVAGALNATGFDQAWEQFHVVFFGDNYRFNPTTERLIQIYPEAFWQSIVFFIGMMVVAEALLLLIGCIIYLGVTGHKRQPSRRLETYSAPA
jgi:integral membrane protein (TIGR01906 family)